MTYAKDGDVDELQTINLNEMSESQTNNTNTKTTDKSVNKVVLTLH